MAYLYVLAAVTSCMVRAVIPDESDGDIESARMELRQYIDDPPTDVDHFIISTAWALSMAFRAAIVADVIGLVEPTPTSTLFPRIGIVFSRDQLFVLYLFSRILIPPELMSFPIAAHQALQLAAVGFEGWLVLTLWSIVVEKSVTLDSLRHMLIYSAVSLIIAYVDPVSNSARTVYGAVRSSRERITQMFGYMSVVASVFLVKGGIEKLSQLSPDTFILLGLGYLALWKTRANPPLV